MKSQSKSFCLRKLFWFKINSSFTSETYIGKAYEEISFDKLTTSHTLETFCVKLIHCEN